MTWNRQRYFTLGVILFLLGVQFRLIDTFVLNEPTTRTLHKMTQNGQFVSRDPVVETYMAIAPSPKKAIQPPEWLGWVLLTIGGVISLHAMILPKDS